MGKVERNRFQRAVWVSTALAGVLIVLIAPWSGPAQRNLGAIIVAKTAASGCMSPARLIEQRFGPSCDGKALRQAESHLAMGAGSHPDGAPPAVLGITRLLEGEPELALVTLEVATGVERPRLTDLFWRGVAGWQSGEREVAIASWRAAGAAKYFLYEGLLKSSDSQTTMGEEEWLLLAIEIAPNLAEANIALGDLYRRQGQLDQAISAYQRAAHSGRLVVTAYLALGNTYLQQERWEDAIAVCQMAHALAPRNVAVNEALGWAIWRGRRQFDEALAHLWPACEDKARPMWACLTLGNVYREHGDQEQAREAYELAYQHDPSALIARIRIGDTYLFGEGQLENAAAVFEAIATEHPDYALAHQRRVLTYLRLKQWHKAAEAANQAATLEPSVDHFELCGFIALAHCDIQAAEAAYAEARRLAHGNKDLVTRLDRDLEAGRERCMSQP